MKKKYINPEIICVEIQAASMLCVSYVEVKYDDEQSIDEEEEIW